MSITHSLHDSQQLSGTRWRLDPSSSSAEFRVPNVWGLSSVKGRFQRLDGWLEIDDDHRWSMELTLEAAGLDTGNPRRDRHLRSPDFFDVQDHPEVRFRSTSVTDFGGDLLQVAGELEAAGERARLQVEVSIERGDGRIDLDAAATVDQRQLGMTFSPLGVIRTPTALTVHASLRPSP
jgi:polyisoprenoid-binding protein YceI